MGIRESLNTNPLVGGIVGVLLVVLAGAVLYHFFAPEKSVALTKACYSDDDGQTFYLDDVYKVAPYDHEGKEAVRAVVFTYDNGSKKYIGYLQKYNQEYKQKLDDSVAKANKDGIPLSMLEIFTSRDTAFNGFLIKAPGPGHPWVPMVTGSTEETGKVMNAPSPDGTPREIYIPE